MLNRVLAAVVLVAAAGSAGVWLAAQAPAPVRIFEGQASLRAVDPQPGPARVVVRARVDLLQDAGRRGDQVLVPVPGGGDAVVTLSHFETQAGGFFAAGPIVGTSAAGERIDGEVALTIVDDRIVGRMVRDGRLYRISRLDDASAFHRIEEVELSTMPLESQPVPVQGDTTGEATPAPDVPAAADSNAIVDLLIAYTPAARVRLGGTAGIQAEATAAVNNANLALQNSGVTHRYRLVFTGEVSYTEAGDSGTDLSRLRTVGDGHLDEVHGR